MSEKRIPGTVIPDNGLPGGAFALLHTMIESAGGLSLGQVSAITGLEYSTIQNWVKRGFVAHPVHKKYYDRHLARILIIALLHDSMRLDDIGELLRRVNGDATDESDDIIAERDLYDCLCRVIEGDGKSLDEELLRSRIESVIEGSVIPSAAAKRQLTLAMLVMVNAYRAGELQKEARRYFSELKLL